MANGRNRMQRSGRRPSTVHGGAPRRWPRVRNRIIAWGALAGAIVAIFSVWTTIANLLPGPDPVHRASFTSVIAVTPVRLSEHKGRVSASRQSDMPRRNGSSVASATVTTNSGYRVVLTAQSEPAQDTPGNNEPAAADDETTGVAQSETGPTADEATSEVTGDDTRSEPTTDDTQSETGQPSGDQSVEPTEPNGAAERSSPSGEVVVKTDRFTDTSQIRELTADAVRQLRFNELCVTRDCPSNLRVTMQAFTAQMTVDPEGNDVPADQVADRLIEFFDQVRSVPTSVPADDAGQESLVMEPVGASVTANLELEGLRGRELRLFWTIFRTGGDGTPLFGRWLGDTPVYRIQPQNDLVSTSVRLWVPLPEAPGSYIVQLTLASDGSPLAAGNSNPFE